MHITLACRTFPPESASRRATGRVQGQGKKVVKLHQQAAPRKGTFKDELGQLVIASVKQLDPTMGANGYVTLSFDFDPARSSLKLEAGQTYVLSPRYVCRS